ncbi:MAG TPA: G5 domain-containing protein [Candidatus Saccharimonadales bacterium]|nr:G5 domain-containing protein [Candidatus Saccharimonadales bacterium]
MRFIPSLISNPLSTARKFGRHHVHQRPYIVPILGILLGIAIVGGVILSRPTQSLRPSDSHVVYLSDNGQRETLDTKAATVGELVGKLPLHLMPQDVVEPSLDTKIVQDNFRINVYRARPVTVEDNGVKTVTITAQKSPRVVAENAGLTVYPEDNVSFAPGSIQENIIGEKVVVDPATPVQFSLYGTPLTIRTHAKTVAALLEEKNVKLSKGDTVQPAGDTPVTPGMQIFVNRNGTTTITAQEQIPAPVQTVPDPNLTLGATAVRQAGTPGVKAVTYQITTINGVQTSKSIIQQVIVSQPVAEILAQGTNVDVAGNKTSLMAAAGIGPSDYGYVDYIVSHESGWCPTKAQGEGYCPITPDNSMTPNGYGLCQSTPGYKMQSAGADWATNPITQLRWCDGYAAGRYGSWYSAYLHWAAYHNW